MVKLPLITMGDILYVQCIEMRGWCKQKYENSDEFDLGVIRVNYSVAKMRINIKKDCQFLILCIMQRKCFYFLGCRYKLAYVIIFQGD